MPTILPVTKLLTTYARRITSDTSGSLLDALFVAKTDDKHKQIIEFSYVDSFQPKLDPESFVAPNVTLAGNVEVC